jgi:hypothetical protein
MLYGKTSLNYSTFLEMWKLSNSTIKAAWILSDNHAAQGRRIVEQE